MEEENGQQAKPEEMLSQEQREVGTDNSKEKEIHEGISGTTEEIYQNTSDQINGKKEPTISLEQKSGDPKLIINKIRGAIYTSLNKIMLYGHSEGSQEYNEIKQWLDEVTSDSYELPSSLKDYKESPTGYWQHDEYQLLCSIKQFLSSLEGTIDQSPEALNKFDTKTDKLTTEELDRELKMRCQIIALFDDMVKFCNHRDEAAKMDIYFMSHERTIQLGAYMLGPNLSTSDFLELYEIFDEQGKLRERRNEDEFWSYLTQTMESFWIKNGGWKNRKVLEFGGSETASKLSRIGAKGEIIDAGHSGYTFGYHVSQSEKMIRLENYHKSKHKASFDMICSANTLDWESGIEEIADAPAWVRGNTMATQSCLMAEDELALLFYGLLKPGGYMIHDERGLPEDLCNLIGIGRTSQLVFNTRLDRKEYLESTWGDERLHFYKKIGKPQIRTVVIGNKIAKYNEDEDTWEYAGSRRQEGQNTTLTTDEFIFCAKRDIEYGGEFIRGETVGEQRLTDDEFMIECAPKDIGKLLKYMSTQELARSLSDDSRSNIKIWRNLINRVKESESKTRLINLAPEGMRNKLS